MSSIIFFCLSVLNIHSQVRTQRWFWLSFSSIFFLSCLGRKKMDFFSGKRSYMKLTNVPWLVVFFSNVSFELGNKENVQPPPLVLDHLCREHAKMQIPLTQPRFLWSHEMHWQFSLPLVTNYLRRLFCLWETILLLFTIYISYESSESSNKVLLS